MTVVLVDDFAFLGPQGVLQVGKLKVLLLSMSVVLGDCCPTSLILKIQDVCKSEELKVSEKEKIRIKITKYIVHYQRTSTFYVKVDKQLIFLYLHGIFKIYNIIFLINIIL
jgi:hypothetical protein